MNREFHVMFKCMYTSTPIVISRRMYALPTRADVECTPRNAISAGDAEGWKICLHWLTLTERVK